jgi:hypothetical protein
MAFSSFDNGLVIALISKNDSRAIALRVVVTPKEGIGKVRLDTITPTALLNAIK